MSYSYLLSLQSNYATRHKCHICGNMWQASMLEIATGRGVGGPHPFRGWGYPPFVWQAGCVGRVANRRPPSAIPGTTRRPGFGIREMRIPAHGFRIVNRGLQYANGWCTVRPMTKFDHLIADEPETTVTAASKASVASAKPAAGKAAKAAAESPTASEKPKTGRPSSFREDYHPDRAMDYALLGMTNQEIADALGIHLDTLHDWRRKYPAFSYALKAGKEVADGKVARSLYRKAKGATIRAIKAGPDGQPLFDDEGKPVYVDVELPGDTTAQIFWLKNRRSNQWRDKQAVEHTGADGKDLIPETDANELARRVAFLLQSSVQEQHP